MGYSPRLLEIEPSKTYTEPEYRKVQAELEEVKKDFKEAREKWAREHPRDLHRQLVSRYFSEAVVGEIIDGKVQLKTGRRCEMTILSCDIRGFSKFANDVDPEYLTRLLDKYLIDCTKIIHNHDGAVDKYLGDGILAYFGCLNQEGDHAVNACKAGMQIIKNQNSILQGWYEKLLAKDKYLGIGIGIASGFTYWDYIGTPSRKELTIIGKHVNLASRLQTEANPGDILITNITKGLLKSQFHCEKLKKVLNIKGFERSVDVFRLQNKPTKQKKGRFS